MGKLDWQKHKPLIAEKTLQVMAKEYPGVTKQRIEEAIDLFHTSQPPRDEADKMIFHALKTIELGLKIGWLK